MKMSPEPILDAIVNRGVSQLPELPPIDGAAEIALHKVQYALRRDQLCLFFYRLAFQGQLTHNMEHGKRSTHPHE